MGIFIKTEERPNIFENGLTLSSNVVSLGGNLIKNTTIGVGSYTLTIGNIAQTSTGIGFNGATPIAKPTVSGSRGANAALESLLTQLAAYGLITNSTIA